MPNSTNWGSTTTNTTNWTAGSVNSTNWEIFDDNGPAGYFLLETGYSLLFETSDKVLLE